MNSQGNSENRKGKKSKFFSSWTWFIIRTLLYIALCTFLICTTVFIGYMFSLDAKVDIEVEAMQLNYSSIVYYLDEDGNEQEFERLYDSQNRTWVNLEDMPEYLKDAAIAIEDHRFEKHHGVDWKRTFSASINMFFKFKSDYGASTITQQLVKNLTGDNQDSVRRKLQEIMRALYLERHYDKDTIIEMYLNTIYLGEGCYGVGTAAQAYYGKEVSDLTLAESAALVGITNLPTYYNPYINPENNKTRRVNILNRMYDLEMISEDECIDAKNEDIKFNTEARKNAASNVQSYFVDQIIEDLLDDLVEECGYSQNVALRTIYSGGLKIYATVNPEMQAAMDEVFEDESLYPKYKGNKQPECAMILLDPTNGDVLAMRGGRGEKTGARVLNRATQTKRPPGSSIKPIAVYAPAIEYGLITPFSVEDDAPLKLLNGAAYPKNETRTYSGRTTITKAVEQSINTVSMRTLEKLTIERSYNFLTANLGITSLTKKGDKNLAPLSLGQLTNGITVLEMAAAYAPFANGGTYYEPRTYTKVLDSNGEVLLEKDAPPVQAMTKKTATYMSYMLQNVVSHGTGTYAKLQRGMPAAAKTGTSNNDEDRWFVGYTPYYVGAVWFGYDQPKYIAKSLSPALTTWEHVMNRVHKNLEVKNFEKNSEFKTVNVCSCSGLLPTENCKLDPRGSRIVAGYFHKDDVPKKACNVHVSVEIDGTTNMLTSEFCPSDSKKTVSFMKLKRFSPAPGVALPDQQYVIHDGDLPSGMHYYLTDVDTPMNQTCTLHTSAASSDSPENETDEDEKTEDENDESTGGTESDISSDGTTDEDSLSSEQTTPPTDSHEQTEGGTAEDNNEPDLENNTHTAE